MENDGLIYRPLVQSLTQSSPEKDNSYDINDLIGPTYDEVSFPVEPVKDWFQPSNFDRKSVSEDKPDNYVDERVTAPGRVYKPSEKENFKRDLHDVYTNVIMDEYGFDEDLASEYAKRIVAQDALESRWGQSDLVKWYNFGGVKDFRENSDSLKFDTVEYENNQRVTKKQPFRKFKDLKEYIRYKVHLLGNDNYNVFSYAPEMLYKRLVTAKKKYATDPKYESKLNSIYNTLWRR